MPKDGPKWIDKGDGAKDRADVRRRLAKTRLEPQAPSQLLRLTRIESPTDSQTDEKETASRLRETLLDGAIRLSLQPRDGAGTRRRNDADRGMIEGVLVMPGIGDGGELFALRSGRNWIGSAPHNHLVISGDRLLMGQHALIDLTQDGAFLRIRTRNCATRVNGELIEEAHPLRLKDRDRLLLGNTKCHFFQMPWAARR